MFCWHSKHINPARRVPSDPRPLHHWNFLSVKNVDKVEEHCQESEVNRNAFHVQEEHFKMAILTKAFANRVPWEPFGMRAAAVVKVAYHAKPTLLQMFLVWMLANPVHLSHHNLHLVKDGVSVILVVTRIPATQRHRVQLYHASLAIHSSLAAPQELLRVSVVQLGPHVFAQQVPFGINHIKTTPLLSANLAARVWFVEVACRRGLRFFWRKTTDSG